MAQPNVENQKPSDEDAAGVQTEADDTKGHLIDLVVRWYMRNRAIDQAVDSLSKQDSRTGRP
ncbi:MAG: hypothetical protein ACRDJE_13205 [Dehalococcoidia bacterium]